MRLSKIIPDVSLPHDIHGYRARCAYTGTIAKSALCRIGSYSDILPRRARETETGWYADSFGIEIYSAAVYGYGDSFVGIVESNDADSTWVLDEGFENQEDAAERAHGFAECLAEHERIYTDVWTSASGLKADLLEANDKRRNVIQCIREHGNWGAIPENTRTALSRIWRETAHERGVCFDRIRDEVTDYMAPEFIELWYEAWNTA